MNNRSFNIKTISYDLSREQTIYQIVNSLDHLEQTFNQLFDELNTKIKNTRQTIHKYDERVNLIDFKKISAQKNDEVKHSILFFLSYTQQKKHILMPYIYVMKNMQKTITFILKKFCAKNVIHLVYYFLKFCFC